MEVTKKRKLPMSDDEIAVRFRQAADPAAQIKILAELNNVGVAEMRERLADLGFDVPRGRKPVGQKLDPAKALAAYKSGMTDMEMVEAFGVSQSSVQKWREREKLPPNTVAPANEPKPDAANERSITTVSELLSALEDICAKFPDAKVFVEDRKPVLVLLSALYDGPTPEVEVTLVRV